MKAKEMFEKLDGVFSVDIETKHHKGYGEYDITYVTLHFVDSNIVITFDGFNNKYWSIDSITVEEHQAITQQMKELGWLE